ncbi:RagB/SusD family nutrient uptake outer membrane protein [Carboxylicivirga sp. M1479]|uniref:RagB/SusD family nutrient uptake outer membrane protein n=1 Tax=Carboxylicivirga sp. M1479 TaxID=2594476 RepID=UPI00163DA002|nr:RagB/SusD family nutrient uptake outer membrane protein [Carboxylicivirga sp. M1479]
MKNLFESSIWQTKANNNRMKSIKIYIPILLVFMAALQWSCSDDFLTEEPTTALPSDDVFKSIITADAALVGAYDALSTYSFEGLYWPIMSDLMGDDVMVVPGAGNWGWFVEAYQLELLPNYSWVDSPWWAAYKIIYDANQFVAYGNTVPDATEEQKNELVGQGKALRALVMLKLAQLYAPAYHTNPDALSIINVTEPVDANSEDYPRALNREVYAQIESDLLSAVSLLDNNGEGSRADNRYDEGFLDKRGANALLARLYQDMHEWEKARDHAKAAYEGLELMSLDYWVNYGFSYRTSETIFTVAYTLSDNNTYLSIPSFYYPIAGYSSIRLNDEFVNLYRAGDARKEYVIYQDDEIDTERHFTTKFIHNNQVGNAERISIRATEMYLIEAECEAELGNYGNAQDALWAVQERVFSRSSKSSATGQALIDEILLERRKELFGEGFRLNDIKRRSLPILRKGDHWADADFVFGDDNYYRLTFPIPQSEIDANPLINEEHQNEGY